MGESNVFANVVIISFKNTFKIYLELKYLNLKYECQQLQIKQYGFVIIINHIDYCHFIKSINISKKEIFAFDKRRTEKLENANWVNELARPDILLAC